MSLGLPAVGEIAPAAAATATSLLGGGHTIVLPLAVVKGHHPYRHCPASASNNDTLS